MWRAQLRTAKHRAGGHGQQFAHYSRLRANLAAVPEPRQPHTLDAKSGQHARLYQPEFRAAVAGQSGQIIAQMLDADCSDRLTAQSNCDIRFYLAEDIFPKVDMMSMATSLEARVPYLDNDLLDLALAIPAHMKVRHGERKYILKKAFAGPIRDGDRAARASQRTRV
jgi:asparagine synthetase B (glutamine-hydrolysing)